MPCNSWPSCLALWIGSWLAFAPSQAQVLAQPGASRSLEVFQFGLARDARYVFCETHDCPQRSLKHWASVPEGSSGIGAIQATQATAKAAHVTPLASVPNQALPSCEPIPPLNKTIHRPRPRKRPKPEDIECRPLKK